MAGVYTALYDRVVAGFAPYETLMDPVARLTPSTLARQDVPAPESVDAVLSMHALCGQSEPERAYVRS